MLDELGMARKGKARKGHPSQGRLPIDGLEGERYDPRPQPSRKGVGGEGGDQETGLGGPEAEQGGSEAPGQLPLRGSESPAPQTESLEPPGPGKKGEEAQISKLGLAKTTDDKDTLVDQFCEQVARILARGKRAADPKANGKE